MFFSIKRETLWILCWTICLRCSDFYNLWKDLNVSKCFPIKYLLDFWDSWILLNIGWRPLHNSALQRRGAHLRRGHHHPAEGGRQLWQKPGHQVLIAQPWFHLEPGFCCLVLTWAMSNAVSALCPWLIEREEVLWSVPHTRPVMR